MQEFVYIGTCPRCGVEFRFTGRRDHRRICPPCKRMSHLAAVAKYGHPNRKPEPTREKLEPLMAKPPNWSRLVQCVQPEEDIYLMGRLYAANVVYEDIRSGLVKTSSFKPVQERA